jgi:hypothetical protein
MSLTMTFDARWNEQRQKVEQALAQQGVLTRGRLRFMVEAGVLVRRRVVREIRRAAFTHGCAVDVVEDRGALDSLLEFQITGPAAAISRLRSDLERWLEPSQYRDAQ